VKRLSSRLGGVAGLVAVALASVGLAGCNARFSPYAAVVNGTEISQQQLDNALSAISTNSGYKCLIQAGPGGSQRTVGAGDGTYDSSFAASVLSILIQDTAVHDAVESLRLDEPPRVVAVAAAQLADALTPPQGSPCTTSGAATADAFPASYRATLLQFQIDQDAIAAHLAGTALTASAIAAFKLRHPDEASLSCLSVIVVHTRKEARTIRAQAVRGVSFKTLAQRHSIDPSASNGGNLGCLANSELSSPLNVIVARLPAGAVSSPIAFSSEWVLIRVSAHPLESFSQLVPALALQEESAVSSMIPRIVRASRVTVDPQYGTWNSRISVPAVQPNSGPPARFVPNPGAVVGTLPPASG
jgi:PPIC-type PPIASE domain